MSNKTAKNPPDIINNEVQALISDLHQIIEQARKSLAVSANYELTMMYWHIGNRINRDVLGNERAAYGEQIVATVSRQLQLLAVLTSVSLVENLAE